MIRRALIWLGLWIARLGGYQPPAPCSGRHVDLPEALVRVARVLCLEEDARSAEGTSGEYKRHRVYAALRKTFPQRPKRDLALAIELALR